MFENTFFISLIGFLVVLTPLVFIHELGHYLAAIKNGVIVEQFSVGFGPELMGFTDKHNTRWKVCLIPFGGYVKMKGELLVNNENYKNNSVNKVKINDQVILHWRVSKGMNSSPINYLSRIGKINAGQVTTFQEYAVISENRITKIKNFYKSFN